jgi:hypothetical protein
MFNAGKEIKAMKHLTFHCIASLLYRFIASLLLFISFAPYVCQQPPPPAGAEPPPPASCFPSPRTHNKRGSGWVKAAAGVGEADNTERERIWSSLGRQKNKHGLLVIIHIL